MFGSPVERIPTVLYASVDFQLALELNAVQVVSQDSLPSAVGVYKDGNAWARRCGSQTPSNKLDLPLVLSLKLQGPGLACS